MPDALQRAVGTILALLSLPLIILLGAVIRLETGGPVVFRAARVGANGQVFTCYKLRTMGWNHKDHLHSISTLDDPRITRVGRVLRRARLDEVPQLWNVVRGEMLLVGPRPEDPRFVDLDDPLHRLVFTSRPGITGLTQLLFLREAELLTGDEPERAYRERVLPEKLAMDARYLENRSAALDLWILWATIRALAGHAPGRVEVARRAPQGAEDPS